MVAPLFFAEMGFSVYESFFFFASVSASVGRINMANDQEGGIDRHLCRLCASYLGLNGTPT